MAKINKHIPIFMLLGLLTACSSTRITSSWREPNKDVIINNLNKVLVVAIFKNETTRHEAENQMASYLKGKGVVSYDYLNETFNKQNKEALRDKIRQDGFDGAITMRLIDVDKKADYAHGSFDNYPSYYRSFSGYYYGNIGYYNNPGYYTFTKTYTVETNVYSIKEDKIIWTGLTKSVNPDGVDKMVSEISKVVYKRMIKEGFIKK